MTINVHLELVLIDKYPSQGITQPPGLYPRDFMVLPFREEPPLRIHYTYVRLLSVVCGTHVVNAAGRPRVLDKSPRAPPSRQPQALMLLLFTSSLRVRTPTRSLARARESHFAAASLHGVEEANRRVDSRGGFTMDLYFFFFPRLFLSPFPRNCTQTYSECRHAPPRLFAARSRSTWIFLARIEAHTKL